MIRKKCFSIIRYTRRQSQETFPFKYGWVLHIHKYSINSNTQTCPMTLILVSMITISLCLLAYCLCLTVRVWCWELILAILWFVLHSNILKVDFVLINAVLCWLKTLDECQYSTEVLGGLLFGICKWVVGIYTRSIMLYLYHREQVR